MTSEVVGGRYQLGRVLGDGWFGEVFLATDLHLKYNVAIKLLRKGPDEATSLLKEGEYLKALESPFIVHVENADIADDIGYLATEYATGRSVEDQLEEGGMAPDRVVPIVRQALVGLRACHEHRLVHCDIKPGNIFLHEQDRVALGDFGAAGRMDERGEVRVGGDPRVRAPEMLRGGSGSVRTDIFSMGVTVYRMLTGAWPVDWEDDFALLRKKVVERRFERIADRAPHVPQSLVNVVQRAMQHNPSARFQSAEEMSQALGRIDLRRRWARIQVHSGHCMCFADAPRGVPSRQTCVVASGATYSIVTRRATGIQSRVRQLCVDGLPERRVMVELRRILRAD